MHRPSSLTASDVFCFAYCSNMPSSVLDLYVVLVSPPNVRYGPEESPAVRSIKHYLRDIKEKVRTAISRGHSRSKGYAVLERGNWQEAFAKDHSIEGKCTFTLTRQWLYLDRLRHIIAHHCRSDNGRGSNNPNRPHHDATGHSTTGIDTNIWPTTSRHNKRIWVGTRGIYHPRTHWWCDNKWFETPEGYWWEVESIQGIRYVMLRTSNQYFWSLGSSRCMLSSSQET